MVFDDDDDDDDDEGSGEVKREWEMGGIRTSLKGRMKEMITLLNMNNWWMNDYLTFKLIYSVFIIHIKIIKGYNKQYSKWNEHLLVALSHSMTVTPRENNE